MQITIQYNTTQHYTYDVPEHVHKIMCAATTAYEFGDILIAAIAETVPAEHKVWFLEQVHHILSRARHPTRWYVYDPDAIIRASTTKVYLYQRWDVAVSLELAQQQLKRKLRPKRT